MNNGIDETVVVVGLGFGGLRAAKSLARENVSLVLIDKKNHHLFQPLLYQVATAGLSPAEIAVPIRSEFSGNPRVEVLLAEVTGVDLVGRRLQAGDREILYDYLVLATGASHSYFRNPEWEDFAPGLKTLEQATEIRRRVLLAFEKAETEISPEKKREWLTFVIVGAGPTGVELAGAIREISTQTLRQDFRHIRSESAEILLVEAGPRVLPQFHEKISKRAQAELHRMGIEVQLNSRVTRIDATGVHLGDRLIRSPTVLWAAGVQPSFLAKQLGVPLDRSGRVIVSEDLSLADHPEVFVIGDMASVSDGRGGSLPGVAPAAIQQGRFVARQIRRRLGKKTREKFRYFDKGQMATIGRRSAVLEFGRWRMGGLWAWLAWLFVHIYYLAGFKNKFSVFIDWTWSYVTFKKGARLIVGKDWKQSP